MPTRPRLPSVALLLFALASLTGATGCGHSEEEMQAVQKELDQCRAQQSSSGTAGSTAGASCSKDTDCKGDRVCNAGVCSPAR